MLLYKPSKSIFFNGFSFSFRYLTLVPFESLVALFIIFFTGLIAQPIYPI